MRKHDLHGAAFPSLSETEMAALGTCPLTVLKKYKVGEKLFELGDCDCNFFVVKSGEIAVVDEAGDTPQVIAVHRPGGFTGEIAQMTGSPALVVKLVARCDSREFMSCRLMHFVTCSIISQTWATWSCRPSNT